VYSHFPIREVICPILFVTEYLSFS
jgi:hypothetical protein